MHAGTWLSYWQVKRTVGGRRRLVPVILRGGVPYGRLAIARGARTASAKQLRNFPAMRRPFARNQAAAFLTPLTRPGSAPGMSKV